MKTKRLKTLLIALLGILLFTHQAYPQTDECMKNLSLYYEFYKHGNYRDAIGPWRKVFNDCPESKESMYYYGINMYKAFIEKESNPEVINNYIDTIMLIYDQRIEYFPKSKGDQLGRKGVDYLRYKRHEGTEAIKAGYQMLSESVEIEKERSSAPVITTFISAGITLFVANELEGNILINDYVNASKILEAQFKRKPNPKTKKAMEAIDQNIKDCRVLTCESIENIFGAKFAENIENEAYLNQVADFLNEAGNCEKTDFYAKVAEQRYKLSPSASAAYDIAIIFQSKVEYEKAKEYFIKAIESAENPEDQANYNFRLAQLHAHLQSFQEAAKYALEATSLKPDWGEPYILLGKSYIFGNASLGDEFEKRTAYWLAVDMFIKAKAVDPSISEEASKLINENVTYFPSKEDLFFRSIKEGSSYKVGGWIQRTTTARPKQ